MATGLATCLLGAPLVATAAPSGVDDGINVTHYGVNLNYQRDPEVLSGVTTILAEADRKLPSFDLSFLLAVSSVTVNNEPAGFTAKDGKLTVTPKEPIEAGSQLVIVVRYRDNPASHPATTGWGWIGTPTGAVAVSAARWWYPNAVDPADRATQSVVIVVPKGLEAVSNGELPVWGGPEPVPGGDRWSWWNKTPQSASASLLAIGQYELTTSTGSDGRPFTRAYGADLGAVGARARASVERTPEIHRALTNWFGPDPFEGEGGLVDSTFRSVVATATRPTYAASSFDSGENASMVAHEIAHQWYGVQVNAVGLDTQWLSEGFATYAEFLWSELEGLGTAAEVAQYTFDEHPADDPDWKEAPAHPDPDSIRSFPIYTRGALALQALRTKVGDAKFFETLQAWVTQQKTDEVPTTAEFIALAEQISGQDLGELFQAWIYSPQRPATGPNGQLTAKKQVVKPKSYNQITANSQLLSASGHGR